MALHQRLHTPRPPIFFCIPFSPSFRILCRAPHPPASPASSTSPPLPSGLRLLQRAWHRVRGRQRVRAGGVGQHAGRWWRRAATLAHAHAAPAVGAGRASEEGGMMGEDSSRRNGAIMSLHTGCTEVKWLQGFSVHILWRSPCSHAWPPCSLFRILIPVLTHLRRVTVWTAVVWTYYLQLCGHDYHHDYYLDYYPSLPDKQCTGLSSYVLLPVYRKPQNNF